MTAAGGTMLERRLFLASAGLVAGGVIAGGCSGGSGEARPRPERSVLDYRATGDRDDTAALVRGLADLTARGGGVLRLPARRGSGADGAYRVSGPGGLALDASNVALLGEGEDGTMIEGTDDAPVLTAPSRPAAGVRIADLTVRGRGTPVYWNGAFAARDFTFERVTFAVTGNAPVNCIHFVHDHLGQSDGFQWLDCTFRGGRRMGVELQNHRHDIVAGDRVPRYRRHRFVRPRVLDQGSMGLSFSGAGSGVEVIEPRFERVAGALVEGIGVTGLLVRDLRVLVDDLPGDDQLIRCGNRFPSRDVVVDGLTLVSRRGAATTSRTIVRLDNTRRFRLARIAASVIDPADARKALEFGINLPSADGVVTGCDLSTSGPYVIANEGCTDLRIHHNHLRSTATGDVQAVRSVGISGSCSTLLGVNQYDFPHARSRRLLFLGGNARGHIVSK